MATKMETASQPDEASTPKFSAPKDKTCPFCSQAFTSSSLGRHLDLYIKEKNPKQPDGVHDVEAIKKLRGNITRRQARPSLGNRRASTPVGTPKPSHHKEPPLPEKSEYKSPAIPRDGQYVVDSYKHPFQPTWEATGVMNDLPRPGDETPDAVKRPGMQRAVSKQVVQKAQFDVKQKLSDAMDTARAAELALRELLSSWRAARLQLDSNSMPFDFDPFSLDFPALTLHCLQPPPTLFSSTQHPTSTSWSVQCPGQREFDALRTHFRNEFDSWKMTCASTTSAAVDDSTFAQASGPYRDPREAVRKAEQAAENLEAQVGEHLQSAYQAWESLPEQHRQELWVLELARSIGRKGKELDRLKQEHHKLKQENTTYKTQIEDLCRLQQPREFKIAQPLRVPMEKALITALVEQGVKCGAGIGGGIEDTEVDLGSIVSKSIERWKNVIASSRVNTTGMQAQRPLDQSAPPVPTATMAPGSPTAPSASSATAPKAPLAPMANGTSQAARSVPGRTPVPNQRRTPLTSKPKQVPPPTQPKPQKLQQQPLKPQLSPQPQAQPPQQQQQQQPTPQQNQAQQQQTQQQTPQGPPLKRVSTTSTNGGMASEQTTGSTTTTAPPSVEETSDQDADAEMEDDDSFAIMNASPTKAPQAPMQPQVPLEVPRTRGPMQHRAAPDPRFLMPNGAGNPVARPPISLSRSMPNMNMAMQNNAMHAADMSMAMQGVRAEPMYME